MPRYVGQIALFPYDFAPSEWTFCDGKLLAIADNFELFQLLGTTFGGDGQESFAKPNLQAPKECNYGISLYGMTKGRLDERVVGETLLWPASTHPDNLIKCAGQALAAKDYPLLKEYMGTRFGGDGNMFNLPNLPDKSKCHYLLCPNGPVPLDFPKDGPVFVAELVLLPFDVPSSEHLAPCQGQLLSKKQHQALSVLLGNRFGGNNEQFALPDLRAAAPTKFNYYISLQGALPPRG